MLIANRHQGRPRLTVALAGVAGLLALAVVAAIHRGHDGQPPGQGFRKVGTFQHSTLWMRIDTAATPGSDAVVSLETTGGPLDGQCTTRTPLLIGITLCDAQLTNGHREVIVATPPQATSVSITIQGRRIDLTVFAGHGAGSTGLAAVGLTGDTSDLPVTDITYTDSSGRAVH